MDHELREYLNSFKDDLLRTIGSQITESEKRYESALSDTESRLTLRGREDLEKVETALLKEFRKWAVPVNRRLKALEELPERVLLLEERLNDIEHPPAERGGMNHELREYLETIAEAMLRAIGQVRGAGK